MGLRRRQESLKNNEAFLLGSWAWTGCQWGQGFPAHLREVPPYHLQHESVYFPPLWCALISARPIFSTTLLSYAS